MLQRNAFSVSKWLKHQVLLDTAEMEELCRFPFKLYNVSQILPSADNEVSKKEFLDSYRDYIEQLKEGKVVTPRSFSCAISVEELHVEEIGPGKYMTKQRLPVIQMQPHRFFFSKIGKTIQPMVMSPESIPWGIQFSYPQIFIRDGVFTKTTGFPNTELFTNLMRWFRAHTHPTTFLYQEEKISTPLRLGKNWKEDHPFLPTHNLGLYVYSKDA